MINLEIFIINYYYIIKSFILLIYIFSILFLLSLLNMKNHKMIFYFLIANNNLKKEIGEYIDDYYQNFNTENISKIKSISKEILLSDDKNKHKTNKITYPDYNIFYTVTSSETFYCAAVKKEIKENLIFELIEDIDHQGIKKLVDRNGELTNVGKQNLQFSIENYQETKKKNENKFINSFFEPMLPKDDYENDIDDNKISLVSGEVNINQKSMIENVKNMIKNVGNKNVEDKSNGLKDINYTFQKNTNEIRKTLKCQGIRNKIIFIFIISLFLFFILYYSL